MSEKKCTRNRSARQISNHTLIQDWRNYPVIGWISLIGFILVLTYVFPTWFAPVQEYQQLMRTGHTQNVRVSSVNWEKYDGRYGPTYTETVSFHLSVDNQNIIGTGKRVWNTYGNDLVVGDQVKVRYLSAAYYSLEGDNSKASEAWVAVCKISTVATGFVFFLLSPFFFLYRRSRKEHDLARTPRRTARVASFSAPLAEMVGTSGGGDTGGSYALLQWRIRWRSINIFFLFFSFITTDIAILHAIFLTFGIDTLSDQSTSIALFLLFSVLGWLFFCGVGKVARWDSKYDYADVLKIHDLIRSHRKSGMKGSLTR